MQTVPRNNYVYECFPVRVKDGDTFVGRIDLGFGCSFTTDVRLNGIDTPEKNTPEGLAAMAFIMDAFGLGAMHPNIKVTIRSYKDVRSFERWICDVWVNDELLADKLRAAGFVKK